MYYSTKNDIQSFHLETDSSYEAPKPPATKLTSQMNAATLQLCSPTDCEKILGEINGEQNVKHDVLDKPSLKRRWIILILACMVMHGLYYL